MNATKATIVSNLPLSGDIMELNALCAEVAQNAKPGQFVMLRSYGSGGGYLGRPFAVAGSDREKGTFRILYKIAGKGTKQIASLPAGADVDIVGPLGKGFLTESAKHNALLVAGGIGVTSLIPLAEELDNMGVSCDYIAGAANKNALAGIEYIRLYVKKILIATEDGSAGEKGYPLGLIRNALEGTKYDAVYGCGPIPLLKAAAEIAREYGAPMQVSLERRMACGFGACMACACKTKNEDGLIAMKRVCMEGPVFDSEEVVWDG